MTAMGEIERLLQASMVRFAIEDPTSADARWCFNQYFAELNRRFEGAFDPGLSISAYPQELTSPVGLLLIARLHGRPIGCGVARKNAWEENAKWESAIIATSWRPASRGPFLRRQPPPHHRPELPRELLHGSRAKCKYDPGGPCGRPEDSGASRHCRLTLRCAEGDTRVPIVGLPAIGSSRVGVKMRTRASVWGASGGNTNVVSGRAISFAICCIRRSSIPAASGNTPSWMPVNG
jgi:hypothetical protein